MASLGMGLGEWAQDRNPPSLTLPWGPHEFGFLCALRFGSGGYISSILYIIIVTIMIIIIDSQCESGAMMAMGSKTKTS